MSNNDSRILMSDSLRESMGNDDIFKEESQKDSFIIVALDRTVAGQSSSVVGVLSSILLDRHIEIEMRISIEDALQTVKSLSEENCVNEVQLHHGDEVVSITGKYVIDAARVQDINSSLKVCVLAMKLVFAT